MADITENTFKDVSEQNMSLLEMATFDKVPGIKSVGGTKSKIIDVAGKYDWTVTPPNKRKKIPRFTMVEYEMDGNLLMSNLISWTKNLVGTAKNSYEGMYRAKETGYMYAFPWFETYHHTVNQSWGAFPGMEGFDVVKNLATAVGAFKGAPGIYINNPQAWNGISPISFTYKITLLNTVNPDAYKKNKALINRLLMSSLHNQQNIALAVPPCIFVVDIPGIRYSPAATIAGIQIENRGILRSIGKDIIPEAYEVTMTIQELIPESRQIFAGAIGGPKVVAIIYEELPETALEAGEAVVQGAVNLHGKAVDATANAIQPYIE